MSAIRLKISSAGDEVSFVHTDELVGLFREGAPYVTRASHVEPTEDGRWTADLSPVGGPVLGPYDLRDEALKAEVDWLQVNLFGRKDV